MKALRIRGGRPLRGAVEVSGAKNAALPLMCCTLLTEEPVVLRGVPDLQDVRSMERLLGLLGVGIHDTAEGDGCVLQVRQPQAEPLAPYELVRTMRASVLVLGPLLARRGRAVVSLPGGCAIGARPIDQHLQGLAAMGADIEVREGYVHASAARLCGSRISFDMPTVGGTENLLMAAALADGETVLENAAREPEIVALAELLQRMGVPIEGAGTSTIRIEGQDALSGAEVRVIPDRIEAGTWLIAAAATGGEVRVTSCRPDHIEVLLEKLIQAGCQIDVDETRIELSAPERLQPCDIRTAPFPGFPTDLQAQWMSLMAVADGATEIIETIFENRFMHVPELMRMGAQIRVTGNVAVVRGPNRLSGAPVMATDLRASAGLVIAALAASGTTEILRIYHLERGYERLDAKLRALGADVELFVRDATVAHVNAAQAAEDRRTT